MSQDKLLPTNVVESRNHNNHADIESYGSEETEVEVDLDVLSISSSDSEIKADRALDSQQRMFSEKGIIDEQVEDDRVTNVSDNDPNPEKQDIPYGSDKTAKSIAALKKEFDRVFAIGAGFSDIDEF
ncbi:hypothetical protein A0J61_04187 [Choanephora cucurbitarum]|uniref:Uncharacterized protein n=1 Tax=Choanephora cucurbitarum TaxID=101091 RepID=A0A1C7NF80_9FUNG|nr:hypothetical protein A0J61_04187 [Choanephora cucurbitarum]